MGSGGRGGYGGGGGGYGGGGSRFGGGGGKFGGKSNSQPGASLRKPRWDIKQLPKFEKNFYREHPNAQARTFEEIEAFRAQHQLSVHGRNVPQATQTFIETSFPGELPCVLQLVQQMSLILCFHTSLQAFQVL